MNKDQNINELIDQIIDRQEAINGFLDGKDLLSDDLTDALQRIAEEQGRILEMLEHVKDLEK